jgi:hypothetical protein
LSFVFEPWRDSEQLTGQHEKLMEFTGSAMDAAKSTVMEMGVAFSEAIENIPVSCEYVDLKFGLKFDAQAGVIVSKVGAQASLDITLRLKPKGQQSN